MGSMIVITGAVPEDIGAVKYKTDFGDMWIIPNRLATETRDA